MKSITCKDLLEKYSFGYNSTIIDLRSHLDFTKGHIPNSYNIPYDLFVQKYINYLSYDKVYFLICEGGERSKKCTHLLLKNNYKAINISDGYKNWKGPVERSRY